MAETSIAGGQEELTRTEGLSLSSGTAGEMEVAPTQCSSSMQQSEFEGEAGHQDYDDEEEVTEEFLRVAKSDAKTAFTNVRRGLLTKLANEDEVESADLDELEKAHCRVTNVIGDLLGLYSASNEGGESKRQRLVSELETLEEQFTAAMDKAMDALCSRKSTERLGMKLASAGTAVESIDPDGSGFEQREELQLSQAASGGSESRRQLSHGWGFDVHPLSRPRTGPFGMTGLSSTTTTSPVLSPTPASTNDDNDHVSHLLSASLASTSSGSRSTMSCSGASQAVASSTPGTSGVSVSSSIQPPTIVASAFSGPGATVSAKQTVPSNASKQVKFRMGNNTRTTSTVWGTSAPNVHATASTSVPGSGVLRPTAQQYVPGSSTYSATAGTRTAPTLSSSSTGTGPWADLKRITIPVFEGDKKRFESWWAAFAACIDSAPVQPECKMLRLRQYLKGEPLQAIDRFGYSAAAYDAAKALLHRKYGGERRRIALHLTEIESMKQVRYEKPKDLERFSDLLAVAVVNLRDLGQTAELGAGAFYYTLLRKLDERIVAKYHRWRYDRHLDESVEGLLEFSTLEATFLVTAAETVSGLGAVSISNPEHTRARDSRHEKRSTFVASAQQPSKCFACHGQHPLWQCLSFKAATPNKRWRIAKDSGVCFRCLGTGHNGRDCSWSRPCGIDGCSKLHHRLLHSSGPSSPSHSSAAQDLRPPAMNSAKGVQQTSRSSGSPPASTSHAPAATKQSTPQTFCSHTPEGSATEEEHGPGRTESRPVSLRTIPIIIQHGERSLHVNALLDDGSTTSYVSEAAAHELGLHGAKQNITVNTLDGTPNTFTSAPVCCIVSSLNGAFSTEIQAWTIQQPTGRLKPANWSGSGSKWQHLKGIRFPPPAKRGRIDVLLGLDCVTVHQSLHEVTGKPGEPIARLTPLGWTCVGPDPAGAGSQPMAHSYHAQLELGGGSINQLLRQFWEVEELAVPDQQHMSLAEEIRIQQTRESLRFSDGRYHVGLPWKEAAPVLPDNFHMARKRLISTERKLLHTDVLRTKYNQIIAEYLDKGYIRQVPKDELKPPTVWYLPHFPVIRLDKETTKVRIVFDGSAQFQDVSVNQFLDKGPKLQRDICDVLLRFRKHPIAIACDIKQMYLQIGIHEADRPYQRFLWRDCDVNIEPSVYEFQRVVFGLASSPFLAQFVSQEHARALASTDPRAAEAVAKSTYMDDTLDSVTTPADGVALYKSLVKLWESAGMHPTKWLSNSAELLAVIPESERGGSIDLSPGDQPRIKTLGISWSADSDAFSFKIPPASSNDLTKRKVLQRVASVFDPLGLLAPYLIRGKMLIQELWTRGLTWDDPLEPSIDAMVKEWIEDAQDLQTLRIPRSLTVGVGKTSLHVFADASEKAMGAVAYLVSEDATGTTSRLVAAKSKVAPLEAVTIPRLELIAAVMAVRLAAVVGRALGIEQVTLWSDSMNVLWWIRGFSRQFKTFVANRVAEIRRFSQPEHWRHVPTAQNPADLISRGCLAAELTSSQLWWNGPTFLTTPELWPDHPRLQPTPAAQREVKGPTNRNEPSIEAYHAAAQPAARSAVEPTWTLDPTNWLDWQKMTRTLAWVRRFTNNCRTSVDNRVRAELIPDELADAELQIIRNTQRDAFAAEIGLLKKGKVLPPNSKLAKLCPFLDDDGVLRCEGRLQYAEFLSRDAVHPIILPRKHAVTKMLVKFYHDKGKHAAGTNATLAALAARFWIIAAREAVREWEQECAVCRRHQSKPATQRMAPLPVSRVVPSHRAFSRIGLDYAGPFLTMQGRGRARVKRYLCLFTCLETRAVHLEFAFSLDTASFINCFFRFVSRRGLPQHVVSDNGSNFVGAVKELKDLVHRIDQGTVQAKTAQHGVSWSFNPPAAPHFGGVFEIMVKAAKRAIYHVLSGSDITDEDLLTAFVGAEDLINSRPITAISVNPNDNLPLTPNHFLNGRLGDVSFPDCEHPIHRWQRVQELLSHVWRRWIREWLPQLSKRTKWTTDQRNVKVGDVMLLLSPDTARRQWPLARVLEVYPSKDQRVRVAKVQVGDRTYVRPISRLCPLEYAPE